MREQRVAELDAQLAAALDAAEAATLAQRALEARVQEQAAALAALVGEVSEARSEAAAKASSCENLSRRATELMQDLGVARAAAETREADVQGAVGWEWRACRWHANEAGNRCGSRLRNRTLSPPTPSPT